MTPQSRYERWSSRTDGPLLTLALVFLVVFLTPLYAPELPPAVRGLLFALNVAIWFAFAVDYAVRLYLVDDRRAFVLGHVPDLLAIALPFLRPLRIVRLAGVFGSAGRRAGRHAQAQATAVLVLTAGVLMVAAGGLVLDAERSAENANIVTAGDALWWAVTTVTTVGYGDRFPVTGEGRIVAAALMLTGIALIGVLTASIAAWFVRVFSAHREPEQDEALREIAERLARLEARLVRE